MFTRPVNFDLDPAFWDAYDTSFQGDAAQGAFDAAFYALDHSTPEDLEAMFEDFDDTAS